MVEKVDGRPIWQKALLYAVLAILPLLLCLGFTFIGSGFIFLVAIMYGMKFVGPKVFILQCLAMGPFKYYVIKEVGGSKKVKNMMT